MIKTEIGNSFDGHNKAYVYIWLSKREQVVYVGMTNSYLGTLGRAYSHFSRKGQLRQRFIELKGYYINVSEDFTLFSFLLPQKREYIGVEKSYREAVEYLVQKRLQINRSRVNPSYDVISWVRISPRTSNSEVIRISDDIVSKFLAHY
ncbi:MAG: hypothetical protein AAF620_00725 [Bacteroidota bacterium]